MRVVCVRACPLRPWALAPGRCVQGSGMRVVCVRACVAGMMLGAGRQRAAFNITSYPHARTSWHFAQPRPLFFRVSGSLRWVRPPCLRSHHNPSLPTPSQRASMEASSGGIEIPAFLRRRRMGGKWGPNASYVGLAHEWAGEWWPRPVAGMGWPGLLTTTRDVVLYNHQRFGGRGLWVDCGWVVTVSCCCRWCCWGVQELGHALRRHAFL